MKIALSAILMGSLLMVGCSGGSSGNGGSDPSVFPQEYDPQTVPANPAPMAYLKSVVDTLKRTEAFIPEEATFFSTILDGEDVKSILEGSTERTEAKAKLNSEGRGLLDQIKSKCTVNNASVSKSGKAEKAGDVLTTVGTMSTTGAACPLVVSQNEKRTTTYDVLDFNQQARSMHMVARVSAESKSAKELRDVQVQSLSGVIGFSTNLSTSVSFDVSQVYAEKDSSTSSSVSANFTGQGNIEVRLASGDVIKGPVSMLGSAVNEVGSSRMLFNGMSSQGAVRLVVIMDQKKDQTAKPEIWLNGEKIDETSFGGLFSSQGK